MNPSPLLAQLSLQAQLQTLMSPLGQVAPWSQVITPAAPPVLYRVKQVWPIAYRSPLLQQVKNGDRFALVAQLRAQLPIHPAWQIQINERSSLDFQWQEGAIAPYLHSLWSAPWESDLRSDLETPKIQNAVGAGFKPAPTTDLPLEKLSPEQLQLQYCHGRCCSLLALAQREGFGVPARPDWLSLNGMGDRAFFSVWLTCGDSLASDRQSLKSLLQLTHAWHRWYAQSQIWGTTPPHLAQARLALIALMQRLLGFYLRQYYGLEPWRST
ncbi:MAG: hypothetical protein ACPGVO_11985 [Spirulinaceae cyanobacterium]